MLTDELKRNEISIDKLELDEADINELLTAEFMEVDDYPGLDETLAAFEHSPEYLALPCHVALRRDACRDHVRPLLELAAEHWLDPDDIDGPILIELIHDLPGLRPCDQSDIESIIQELYAFWAFATRELGYPHGRVCMAMLRGEARRALECAIQNTCDSTGEDGRDSARRFGWRKPGQPKPGQLRAGSSAAPRAGARAASNPRRSAMVIS